MGYWVRVRNTLSWGRIYIWLSYVCGAGAPIQTLSQWLNWKTAGCVVRAKAEAWSIPLEGGAATSWARAGRQRGSTFVGGRPGLGLSGSFHKQENPGMGYRLLRAGSLSVARGPGWGRDCVLDMRSTWGCMSWGYKGHWRPFLELVAQT